MEYLASFINPEAVKQIHSAREESKNHKFATDEEFEKQLLTRDYKDNPYIREIMENSKNGNKRRLGSEQDLGMKIPTDLSFLKDI